MKNQKNVKLYMLIAMLFVLLSCEGMAQRNQTPTITKTFEMNRPGKLEASSSGGGVTVFTHNRSEVVVQAFVRKNGRLLTSSDSQLNDILDDYDIDFEKNGTVINAKIKRKTRFNFRNNTGIALTIIVPHEMSCDVSSSGGGVKVSGVAGIHDFSSSGGGVQIENISGTTKARSSGGGVTATNQKGDCRLSSSGGGVRLTDARGNVYARSSGGGVYLNNVHGDVDASSSGGGVDITGEAGAVSAKSSGGSVRVNISNLSKELSLVSSGGGVNALIHNGENLGLDLDLSSSRVNIELHNFSGTSEKNRVKGTMNNGGIPVYMRSSGGSVNVRYDN